MLLLFLLIFLLFIVALKFYFNGSESSTDYERVIKGERRHGWQLAIPPRQLFKKYHDWPIVDKMRYDNAIWLSESDWVPLSSILLYFDNPSIMGGSVYSVNQYSLIQPNSSSTLLKLVIGRPDQKRVSMCYLSSRIILVSYNQRGSSRMHLLLVDVIARKSRGFSVEMPGLQDVYFTFAYVSSEPKARLHIVFDKHTILTDADHKLEFIDVKYECHGPEGAQSILEPLSSDSIVFPVGSRNTTACFFSGGFPIVSMAYDETDPINTDKQLCFSFDRHRQWHVETLTRWLAKFRETPEGASILNAAKAFSDLNPPSTWRWFRVPAVRPFRYLFNVPGGNEVLFLSNLGGILRRLVKTPSMKRLAAQSIFRAHPELKIFEVEEATGVEISDGIRDDGTEEDSKIVYM